MALTLLANILNLVFALIIVAVLEILIAVLGVLPLIVIILTLDIIFEVCLEGIITFDPWIETTISPSMSSVDWTLLLETEIFIFCLAGIFGCLFRFLVLFLEYLVDFLCFLDLYFVFLLLLELSLLFEELLLALLLSDDPLSLKFELDSRSRSK